jgi:hypothetical protein
MPRILLMIARFALGVIPRAVIGGFCVGSTILLSFADSMPPNAVSIVGISDSDDQNDGETRRGRLAIFKPAILGSVLVVVKSTLVASIESPGDPLILHLFSAPVRHPRGPPPCSANRETQLHPPTIPNVSSLAGVRGLGSRHRPARDPGYWLGPPRMQDQTTAPVAVAANEELTIGGTCQGAVTVGVPPNPA